METYWMTSGQLLSQANLPHKIITVSQNYRDNHFTIIVIILFLPAHNFRSQKRRKMLKRNKAVIKGSK